MDAVDLKLLALLSATPRATITQIAKKARVSQQVADYRIKQLQQHGIITGFHVVVNPLAVGYRLFRIKLWFSQLDASLQEKLLNYLRKHVGIAWAGFVNSTWDLIVDYYAKSSFEVDSFITTFIEKYPIISRFTIFELTEVVEKNYQYINPQPYTQHIIHREEHIDEHEHILLLALRKNCRKTIIALAKETHLSVPTILTKIKSLEKKKIILGYRVFCDPQKFGRESYKLIFFLHNQKPDDMQKLVAFGEAHPLVLYIARYFGNNIIDFEVECKDKQELQEFIIAVRNRFSINELQIVSVLRDIELDHYPFS
ncbi:MAG: Lrp/AsnC family transcriptional regulator [Candidatus Woesearchaeota archaeon]